MIFISYAHRDKEWAKKLGKKLMSLGLDLWLDEYKLHPGEAWEAQIKEALAKSDTLVAIFGEGQPSPNVLVETGMALSQGKQVIPIAIGKHTDSSVFADFRNIQAIQTNEIETAAERIVDAIGAKGELA